MSEGVRPKIIFTEEDLNIINTAFKEMDKQMILNTLDKHKRFNTIIKEKARLIKILSETEEVTNINEIKNSPYEINPLRYTYKNNTIMEVHISSNDEVILRKIMSVSSKKDNLPACVSYRYITDNVTDIINIIDKVHKAINEGII